ITEGSYFSRPGARNERLPLLNIAYYKKITPAQKASFVLNHGLESQFVLLQKNTFSLNAMLERIPIKERPNLISMAFPKFPLQWSFVDFNRQTIMGERMITDTNMQNQVKKIWL